MFTKYAKLIAVAAREGGGDMGMNFNLRLLVDKAKAVNMPKDNIERAIKRGTGELNDGTQLEEVVYEGFGPGGVGVMVETVTDNKNRTGGDIKHLFSSHGGSLGGPGAVQWQFARRGVVRVDKNSELGIKNKEAFELMLIDAGADDIVESEYGLEIRTPIDKFQSVMEAVKATGIEPEESGLEWVAKETITLDSDKAESMRALYEAFDEHDDVRAVYTNES